MADIYRSEILAVVMQQIVDEPVLPTLFLRTVSLDAKAGPVGSSRSRGCPVALSLGDSSGKDVQVVGGVCFDHPSLAVDYQEDLDERTAMGRVYSVCKGYCSCKFWSVVAVAQGAAQRSGREATGAEKWLAGLRREKGGEQGTDGWVFGYLRRRRVPGSGFEWGGKWAAGCRSVFVSTLRSDTWISRPNFFSVAYLYFVNVCYPVLSYRSMRCSDS
jgi:hypothetical protein